MRTKGIPYILNLISYVLKRYGGLINYLSVIGNLYRQHGFYAIRNNLKFIKRDFKSAARNDYAKWIQAYDTVSARERQLISESIASLACRPVITLLMHIHTPNIQRLINAIDSVKNQIYLNWELYISVDEPAKQNISRILSDYTIQDARIKVAYNSKNESIPKLLNNTLNRVGSEWVGLFCHDSIIREHALFLMVQAIQIYPDACLLYPDEDKIDDAGQRYAHYFKTDWNPDLFLTHNFIGKNALYKTEIVKNIGGFREGFDGALDYDLALRYTEQLSPQQIVHIPRILYHRCSSEGKEVLNLSRVNKEHAAFSGQRALNESFLRRNISAKSEIVNAEMYRTIYDVPRPEPLVSIIIPTRNGMYLLKQCVDSVLSKTTYQNYEVIIVDNNSDDTATLEYLSGLRNNNRIRILRDDRPFNYAALNNTAVTYAKGKFLCLMNNDIEVITPQWLEEMVSLSAQHDVGSVGACLWYPNDTLQHGGVILCRMPEHSHKHFKRGDSGYCNRLQLAQTLSAVTAACLVVRAHLYKSICGMDEINLAVAYNDIDFCLRLREIGYRSVWTPYAEFYHHESATRGSDKSQKNKNRFEKEKQYMRNRWAGLLENDPAYNPNLTIESEDFSLAWPPRIRCISDYAERL